jgi:predicted secreted hydrolase
MMPRLSATLSAFAVMLPVAVALAALAAAAGAAPGALPGILPGGPAAAGFAQAQQVRPFVFPRDHGPHDEFRQEWWYCTGNLDAAGGERFGFELTFFRFALQPAQAASGAAAGAAGSAASATGSAWRSREIYMAHFAVTDVAGRRFRFAQKLSRAALGLAGARAAPLEVWIDDWRLAGDATAWHLHAAQPGYQIELTLEPQGPPVLNGEAGLSVKADEPNAASYYYSIPRLRVSGRLSRDGQAREVQGLAWFDHEWGSGGLGAGESGWDWFSLQLADGSALMFYALRDRGGGRDPHSAGTWIGPDGEVRALPGSAVGIEVSGEWRNAEGARYPAGWRIRVPSLQLDLTVRPVLADQELATTPRYWEGAVDARGQRAGRELAGRGYVELVGYARER